MIAKSKTANEKTYVLVYTSPNLVEPNDSTNQVVETLREHPDYQVIEVHEQKARLALDFDMVLCRPYDSSPKKRTERQRFLRDLKRFSRQANVPVYIGSHQDSQDNTLEILAKLGVKPMGEAA